MQILEHAWQFGARHVEKRRVGEDAVEARRGQVQRQEILLPDFAPRIRVGHFHEARRTVQPDGHVPHGLERHQVAPGPQPRSKES